MPVATVIVPVVQLMSGNNQVTRFNHNPTQPTTSRQMQLPATYMQRVGAAETASPALNNLGNLTTVNAAMRHTRTQPSFGHTPHLEDLAHTNCCPMHMAENAQCTPPHSRGSWPRLQRQCCQQCVLHMQDFMCACRGVRHHYGIGSHARRLQSQHRPCRHYRPRA
jgi:hypothetical protein